MSLGHPLGLGPGEDLWWTGPQEPQTSLFFQDWTLNLVCSVNLDVESLESANQEKAKQGELKDKIEALKTQGWPVLDWRDSVSWLASWSLGVEGGLGIST